ncbi:nitrous oxide-stimulated promoter family protein [Gorillibacterium sp. sgz500922]|uniref:nitrous oxide-stimulated promoter family protein n=1 Tax=Gorillibacterium sp. sgz500922 TaxID=3446694 RepID=UPI003F67D902
MARSRIATETLVVQTMISVYCRGQRHGAASLCPDCAAMAEYACERLGRCRFGEAKPFCRECPVHCYKPAMRTKVRAVMRYSGPRMLLHHPVIAVRHLASQTRHSVRRRRTR